MTTLDNPANYIDPSTVSPRPTGMKWGLIYGMVGIVWFMILHFTNAIDYTGQKSNWMYSLIGFAIAGFFYYYAIKQHRDNELGGYISLGRCVMIGMWQGLVAGIISGLFQFIYFSFIEPNFLKQMMEKITEGFADRGMQSDQIEAATKMTSLFMSPGAMFIFGIFGGLIMGLLGGLIVGLFMKKDPPVMA